MTNYVDELRTLLVIIDELWHSWIVLHLLAHDKETRVILGEGCRSHFIEVSLQNVKAA